MTSRLGADRKLHLQLASLTNAHGELFDIPMSAVKSWTDLHNGNFRDRAFSKLHFASSG